MLTTTTSQMLWFFPLNFYSNHIFITLIFFPYNVWIQLSSFTWLWATLIWLRLWWDGFVANDILSAVFHIFIWWSNGCSNKTSRGFLFYFAKCRWTKKCITQVYIWLVSAVSRNGLTQIRAQHVLLCSKILQRK